MESTQILNFLRQASSQIPEIFKPAEAQLKEWETQPEFFAILNIISDFEADVNVRLLATMYMKNGVDKYWMKSAANAICEQEKHDIRHWLLSNFTEKDNQIAVQKAVLISKVARLDYPKDWPELFPTILKAIRDPKDLVQHRALLTLHHVVKAIAYKPREADKNVFQELTLRIYAFILNLWNDYTGAFVRNVWHSTSAIDITLNLEKSLLTLRILGKLTVFGFPKPHKNDTCMRFMKTIFESVQNGLQYRKQLVSKDANVFEVCEKFVINHTKVLASVLEAHPFSFIDFIQPSLELAFHYVFTDKGNSLVFDRFFLQCLAILKAILASFEYTDARRIKNPDAVRAKHIKQSFFQPNVVVYMCRKLVGHYFILTQEELDLWNANPEEFSNKESELSSSYSLRPSIETLFIALFHQFEECLIPFVLELVASTKVLVAPEDMQGILGRDAAYNAIALCSPDICDEINFNDWFASTLLQDLENKHANYKIIRRRVVFLIERWTVPILSSNFRPTLYDCINNLMGSHEDMAVRLAAVSTLGRAIDDLEYNCDEVFKHFMIIAYRLLFNLFQESRGYITRLQVLNVMTTLLKQMGSTISFSLYKNIH